MSNKDKKNTMIGALLVALVFVSVGYALLSTQLEVKGSATIINPDFDVAITAINSTETEGAAKSLDASVQNSKTATFSATFSEPGSTVKYVVNVRNQGNLDAKLNAIELSPDNYGEGFIIYGINGIEAGEVLQVGQSKMFEVVAYYNPDMTEEPTADDLTKDLRLTLDYIVR